MAARAAVAIKERSEPGVRQSVVRQPVTCPECGSEAISATAKGGFRCRTCPHAWVPVRKFVRYENRKIHEVGDANSYVTMERLLGIVAGGAKVEVTHEVTGEDCTARTLARLIYDRCRNDESAYDAEELQKLIMSSPPPDADET